jgi:hypothetical protein
MTGTAGEAVAGCFAGHCDWRIPTIVELRSILDVTVAGCNMGSACIDAVFGPTRPDNYWSTTQPNPEPSPDVWYVWFGGGIISQVDKNDGTFDGFARAVRGGS